MSTTSIPASQGLFQQGTFAIGVDESNPPSLLISRTEREDANKPTFKLDFQGVRTLPYQPFFNAYLSQGVANQTGAGQLATLVADTAISNIGQHYNVTSGQFKAPVSGVYHFSAHISADVITSAIGATLSCEIHALNTQPSQTNSVLALHVGSRQALVKQTNVYPNNNQQFTQAFDTSWTEFMEADQTAGVTLQISGLPQDTVGFLGAERANAASTRFSGYLLG